jgi:hypothetical protein
LAVFAYCPRTGLTMVLASPPLAKIWRSSKLDTLLLRMKHGKLIVDYAM